MNKLLSPSSFIPFTLSKLAIMSLPPGIPALILLIVLSIVGVGIGVAVNGYKGMNDFLVNSPTSTRAFLTMTIALPFWVWAVIKVVRSGAKDLGAISFLLVILSCACVMASTKKQQQLFQQQLSSPSCASILLLVANVTVSLNYLLPFFLNLDLTFSFYAYLVCGSLYWAGMGFWNWKGSSDITRRDGSIGEAFGYEPTERMT